MAMWRELILRYHTEKKIKTLAIHDCALFKNSAINRELSPADILQVMEDFCDSGHGEWLDEQQKTVCRILWRKPGEFFAVGTTVNLCCGSVVSI